jgi:hypothetical protein
MTNTHAEDALRLLVQALAPLVAREIAAAQPVTSDGEYFYATASGPLPPGRHGRAGARWLAEKLRSGAIAGGERHGSRWAIHRAKYFAWVDAKTRQRLERRPPAAKPIVDLDAGDEAREIVKAAGARVAPRLKVIPGGDR